MRAPKTDRIVCTLACLFVAAAASVASAAEPLPDRLSATGLYEEIATKRLARGVASFQPQYPLWSDGARKRRWIALPPGTAIDGSDPDAWIFPVGTRLWKEFAFDRRVETRYLERTSEGWRFATYLWLSDESDALLAPKAGQRGVATIDGGKGYDLPARSECVACHEGNVSPVLGFSALQLATDRDPGALHAEPLGKEDVDLAALLARGWLHNLPAAWSERSPVIAARSADERAALGYLHGNCSSCHNRRGALAELDFSLEVRLDSGEAKSDALQTAVERTARFQPAGSPQLLRLTPGTPEESLLLRRISRRDPVTQMPPLGSRLVDRAAVELITRWIRSAPGATPDSLHPIHPIHATLE